MVPIQEIICLKCKMRDEAYVKNLDEYKSISTPWIAQCANGDNLTYADSFGVERFPKEIKKWIDNKNITTDIYRIQEYDSVMS